MRFAHLVPRTARARAMVVAGFLAVVGIIASVALPVPYVIVSPGPMFDTLADFRGEKIVQISDVTTYPTDGELNMTTVSERGGPYGPLTVGEATYALFNQTMAVIPREILFGGDVDDEQTRQRSAADFDEAQSNAVAAALTTLDIPVTEEPIIAAVQTDGPADGALEPGDIVLGVNGEPTASSADVVAAVQALPPGTPTAITVEREGEQTEVSVTTGDNPNDPGKSFLGVTLRRVFEAPFDIEFTLEGVGGPSAGLMFTLAIIDQLTPESLTGGGVIAGTGTIDPQGNVGAIGGIGQKMDAAAAGGAQLFLAPRANCSTVRENAPSGMTVAAVDTVDEALAALAAHREGRPVVGCGAV